MKATVEISVTERGKKAPQYTVNSDLRGELTFQELLARTKAILLAVSSEVLAEEQARGFDKEPLVIVDGRRGKLPSTVNPLGSIEFVAKANIKDLIIFAFEAVLERSPVDTGLYKNSHIVSHNSRIIAQTREELIRFFDNVKNIKDKDRFRIINIAPYAHKLERYGVSAGRQKIKLRDSKQKRLKDRGVKILKPNGTYVLAVRAIRSKFKNNANIKLEFLPGSYLGLQSIYLTNPHTGKTMRNSYDPKGKYNKGPYIYPTIVIAVQGGGIL